MATPNRPPEGRAPHKRAPAEDRRITPKARGWIKLAIVIAGTIAAGLVGIRYRDAVLATQEAAQQVVDALPVRDTDRGE